MKQKQYREIESYIFAARKNIPDETGTARAIDKNDAWGDISLRARLDGFDELADFCRKADNDWYADGDH